MTTSAAPIAALPAPVDAPSWAAATWPLRAHFDANSSSMTFAVTAPAATRVQLEIYARATGAGPVAVVDAQRGPDGTWRAQLTGVGPGAHYGYRVWGPGSTVDPAWTPGSAAGFVADIGPGGERFYPTSC